MKAVWGVLIFVLNIFDKALSLPIKYDRKVKKFRGITRPTELIGWYIGSSGIFGFTAIIMYRLICQVSFPERNKHLAFDLECVFQYVIGLIICVEAAVCIYTCHSKVHTIVTILNKALDVSRKRVKYCKFFLPIY